MPHRFFRLKGETMLDWKEEKKDLPYSKALQEPSSDLPEEALSPRKVSFKISAIYMVAGVLWILLSDKVVELMVANKEDLMRLSMLKGWFYVFVTALMIYLLIRSALMRIKSTEEKLRGSYKRLSKINQELAVAYEQVDASQNELKLQYEKIVENQRRLKAYEKELEYQAYHDQLTGLQNRRALIGRLDQLIAQEDPGQVALLIVDIDNFKYINDTMGHVFGDNLLIKVSERLGQLTEKNGRIFRLSGDSYVVLLENNQEEEAIEKLALKLLKGFESRFEITDSSLFVSVSIGIAHYPEHGSSLDELLKNADIALYKAKETGKNRIVFYNKPMDEALSERVLLEKHMRTALDNNEFILHYQPQLDIRTNKISGLEALIRWKSPELGFISPLRFISVAEDTHLIIPIGEWVLKNACIFMKNLQQQGYNEMSMSVNISMLQLLQEDFVERVTEILRFSQLDPAYLELEITESIMMESYEAIASKLKKLTDIGIKIALDDFGKGYSSLNYLKQLPISTLKIDKSFIDTIEAGKKDKSLTDLIVKVGRSMGLCVVAEGVETQEQMDYLVKHRCSKIQGYLFSKPVPGEEVKNILEKQA